jgi:hypothetical protein
MMMHVVRLVLIGDYCITISPKYIDKEVGIHNTHGTIQYY